jgi:hypothetical protein
MPTPLVFGPGLPKIREGVKLLTGRDESSDRMEYLVRAKILRTFRQGGLHMATAEEIRRCYGLAAEPAPEPEPAPQPAKPTYRGSRAA